MIIHKGVVVEISIQIQGDQIINIKMKETIASINIEIHQETREDKMITKIIIKEVIMNLNAIVTIEQVY